MAREIQSTNDYREVLLKLIPSEIVAAYMVIDGAVSQDHENAKWLTLGASILLLTLTPLYLRRLYGVRHIPQIVFTTLSFVVWLYSLGGPFRFWGLFHGPLSSAILILWTLIAPLVVGERTGGVGPRSRPNDGDPTVSDKSAEATPDEQGKEVPRMYAKQSWDPGATVVIARDTPRIVNTGSELIEWNRDMHKYAGRRTTIVEVSQDEGSVRLDADGGKHWWATNWIDKV